MFEKELLVLADALSEANAENENDLRVTAEYVASELRELAAHMTGDVEEGVD